MAPLDCRCCPFPLLTQPVFFSVIRLKTFFSGSENDMVISLELEMEGKEESISYKGVRLFSHRFRANGNTNRVIPIIRNPVRIGPAK